MEEPRADLKAGEEEEAPDFDEWTSPEELVRGERTRDDFLDAVIGLDTPATAKEVAERAGHGVDAAREYLEWFEQMGIVRQVTESPATYERNQSYFDWRRVQRFREEYTTEELLDFLARETDRADAFAEEFGVDTPDSISLSAYATETGRSVEDVWDDLTAWKTARQRITLLERALQEEAGDAATQQPAV
jgi:hypothetical protein